MPELLKIDYPEPRVLRVLINRPAKRNAVDFETRQALIEALTAAQSDPSCRAIVLGGVGGVFSAGGDLPSMVGLNEQQARARMRHGHQACRLIANSGVPIVSAAEGFCGGAAMGLALLGDHILVGRGSRILFPFLKLGLVPDWGLLRTLPARVGLPLARRLLTGGQPIPGEEAFRIGLADEYVGDDDVMAAAINRAAMLSRLSPQAYSRMKQRLLQPSATLDQELEREEDDQSALLLGSDFLEGYAAFTEKREPDFGSRDGVAS